MKEDNLGVKLMQQPWQLTSLKVDISRDMITKNILVIFHHIKIDFVIKILLHEFNLVPAYLCIINIFTANN